LPRLEITSGYALACSMYYSHSRRQVCCYVDDTRHLQLIIGREQFPYKVMNVSLH